MFMNRGVPCVYEQRCALCVHRCALCVHSGVPFVCTEVCLECAQRWALCVHIGVPCLCKCNLIFTFFQIEDTTALRTYSSLGSRSCSYPSRLTSFESSGRPV